MTASGSLPRTQLSGRREGACLRGRGAAPASPYPAVRARDRYRRARPAHAFPPWPRPHPPAARPRRRRGDAERVVRRAGPRRASPARRLDPRQRARAGLGRRSPRPAAARLRADIAVVERRRAAVQAELAEDRARLGALRCRLREQRARVQRLRDAGCVRARRCSAAASSSSTRRRTRTSSSVVLSAHDFADLVDRAAFLQRIADQDRRIILNVQRARRDANAAVTEPPREGAPPGGCDGGGRRPLEGARRHRRRARRPAAPTTRARARRAPRRSATPARAGAASRRRIAALEARAGAARGRDVRRAVGDPVADRAVRVRRAEHAAQQRGRVGLLPDHAGDLARGSAAAGPHAYLAPKAEQDRVAARIWNGGRRRVQLGLRVARGRVAAQPRPIGRSAPAGRVPLSPRVPDRARDRANDFPAKHHPPDTAGRRGPRSALERCVRRARRRRPRAAGTPVAPRLRSQQAIGAGSALETSLVNLENGVRGYVASGRERLLEPFRTARRTYPAQAERLSRLVADEPGQQAAVREITEGINDYVAAVGAAAGRAWPRTVATSRRACSPPARGASGWSRCAPISPTLFARERSVAAMRERSAERALEHRRDAGAHRDGARRARRHRHVVRPAPRDPAAGRARGDRHARRGGRRPDRPRPRRPRGRDRHARALVQRHDGRAERAAASSSTRARASSSAPTTTSSSTRRWRRTTCRRRSRRSTCT